MDAGTVPAQNASGTGFLKKPKLGSNKSKKKEIPQGLWVKCPKCAAMLFDKELDENLKVCLQCAYHFPIGCRERVDSLLEPGTFEELDAGMVSTDPLQFPSYPDKLSANTKKSGLEDAIVTGLGRLGRQKIALGVMDFSFLGGSMGSVVGERLARLIEAGTARNLPVVVVSTSGGARMYEGMFSLMQMAKTCGALAYHAKKRLPYISILTDPTYAGVMASYASVGDLNLAEPGAMIGFAGPRVIRDTTQSELPPGFQTSEFLIEHGLIDAVIHRHELKERLAYYIDFLMTRHLS